MREMKDSGIEWIGEVPADWRIVHLKYLCLFKTGGTPSNKVGINVDEEGIPWITPEDITDKIDIRSGRQFISLSALSDNNYVAFPIGSTLLVCIASVGKVGALNFEAYANQQITALKPTEKIQDKRFLTYVIKAASGQIAFDSSSNVVPIVNTKYLSNFSVCLPNGGVQHSISTYLDAKCSEIDALATDIQSEIDTLEKYKKSIITETVTKGLDKNVKTKDSEVYYMAPYNATWRLTKIKYECQKLQRGFKNEDTPLLCTNKGKVSVRPETMSGRMVSEDNAMQGIRKGDIAIHGMDTWHGAIALSDFDGKITRVVHVCSSMQDHRFIVYYLQQLAFNGVYKLISYGVRENTSDFRSWAKVGEIAIALPPVEEQKKICDFIDNKLKEIEAIISDRKRQLDKLDIYKKSLIYEYVTGKKEVPTDE